MLLRFPVAALVAIAALACSQSAPAPAPPGPQRLAARLVPATLGPETRLAVAPEAVPVYRRTVDEPAGIRPSANLPEGVDGDEVALHTRAVGRRGARRAEVVERLERVAVEREPGPPRVPLATARALVARVAGEGPVALQVSAFPEAPPSWRATAAVPAGATLAFGYGILDVAWDTGAPATRFRVRAVGGVAHEPVLFEDVVDPNDEAGQRWHDARLDLSALAGREVAFEFEATPAAGDPAVPALPAWSDPVVASAREDASRLNVLVLSFDTLRARSLGAYGYARHTSPFFDALAAKGTLFENAITTSVTTGPSHMSLFTGLYPPHHGLTRGGAHKRPHVRTLASLLRDAGYQTAAFTEDGYLVREHGFGEGFSRYTENVGQGQHAPGEVRLTYAQARRFLESERQQPFLLFVHTYQVHSPYEPPEPYARLFAGDGLPGPEDPVIEAARDDYDREIRFLDDELRALFATLESTGLADTTLVALLADHGEEFHEHGSFQHGTAVFEESVRVPLVLVGPGVPAGRRHAAPVSLVDVTPTLLDFAGLPAPEGDGTSLRGLIERDEAPPARALFTEARSRRRHVLPPWHFEPFDPPLVAIRTATEKIVVHRPERGEARPPVRYDLVEDPGETSPRPLPPAEAAAVTARVDRYLGRDVPSDTPDEGDLDALGPELRERLRMLGYAE